jgi:predicted phage-related endonuclease
MLKKVELLAEYEAMIEEMRAEADEIKSDIKAEMDARETEELQLGQFIVRFTNVVSSRFDTKKFKEKFGADVYKAFTKEVKSRRFSIA